LQLTDPLEATKNISIVSILPKMGGHQKYTTGKSAESYFVNEIQNFMDKTNEYFILRLNFFFPFWYESLLFI